jgi:hypothetical protein
MLRDWFLPFIPAWIAGLFSLMIANAEIAIAIFIIFSISGMIAIK